MKLKNQTKLLQMCYEKNIKIAELEQKVEIERSSRIALVNKIAELEKENAEFKAQISVLLSCKNCPENKGGLICAKEYENKCLAQKIQFIKELQQENVELKGEADSVLDNWCRGDDPCPHLKKQDEQLTKAKEIMNIAVEGIKYWGIVGGNERPFEKQAEELFNLFLDKAEQFLNSEVEK